MSFISAFASAEITTGAVTPGEIFIDTSDTLSTVMTTGYLNGQTLNPFLFVLLTPTFTTGQVALVQTTDFGVVTLSVFVDAGSGDISLIPLNLSAVSNYIVTAPDASSLSSLSLGSDYQNTLGYDVMLSVYLSVTSALGGNILLGTGPSSSPTQQTIVSSITLAALNIVPINIYLPANYYANLSTSGTISASISGQIAIPI